MSCCKNYTPQDGEKSEMSILGKGLFFVVGLIVITLLLPVIWGVLIYFLFNTSIKNKDTNILPAMTFIWNVILKQDKSKDEDDEEEDDDDESYKEDDYELLNYEKIE